MFETGDLQPLQHHPPTSPTLGGPEGGPPSDEREAGLEGGGAPAGEGGGPAAPRAAGGSRLSLSAGFQVPSGTSLFPSFDF